MMNQSGIYEILNTVNGKRYIGQSQNMKNRWTTHRRELRKGVHSNPKLQRAWNKCGEVAFKFLPILTCAKSMLDFYEQQLLDKVEPEYNIAVAAGAPMRGRKHTPEFCAAARERRHTPEAKAKISARQIGRKNPGAWKTHEFNRGKKRLPETLAKMSKNRKGKDVGRTHTPEACAAISAAHKGKPLSAEHCEKLSESHKGYVMPDSQRANLSKALKGKKKSFEHVAKVAEALRGRVVPPEQRAKISATLKAYNAVKRAAKEAQAT